LPNISGSELKVLAAVLHYYLRTGGGEPTSLRDLEHLTGLSRTTVIASLDSLLESQILERQAEGRSFIYIPIVKIFNHPERQPVKKFNRSEPQMVKNFDQSEMEIVKKFNHSKQPVKKFNHSEPQMVKFFDQSEAQMVKKFYQSEAQPVKNFNHLEPESEESERELINNLSIKDSLSDSLNSGSGKKILLLQKLRACGVYLKTAQAIVDQQEEATIEQQLKYYRYALEMNMADGPGWLVLAINENWPAPLGYEDPEENRFGSCPQCGGPKSRDGFYHNLGCPEL
jgi:hypothetical protein